MGFQFHGIRVFLTLLKTVNAMATARKPLDVRLFVGALYPSVSVLEAGIRELERHFGSVLERSKESPFIHTDYYCREMGKGLKKTIIVFRKLISRDMLPSAKLVTNEIEAGSHVLSSGANEEEKERCGSQGSPRRLINLDPGIMSPENFVLASCKGFSHRIYLSNGVYGDLTLLFRGGSYVPLPWTYPDWGEPQVVSFLNEHRVLYREELKKQGSR